MITRITMIVNSNSFEEDRKKANEQDSTLLMPTPVDPTKMVAVDHVPLLENPFWHDIKAMLSGIRMDSMSDDLLLYLVEHSNAMIFIFMIYSNVNI